MLPSESERMLRFNSTSNKQKNVDGACLPKNLGTIRSISSPLSKRYIGSVIPYKNTYRFVSTSTSKKDTLEFLHSFSLSNKECNWFSISNQKNTKSMSKSSRTLSETINIGKGLSVSSIFRSKKCSI